MSKILEVLKLLKDEESLYEDTTDALLQIEQEFIEKVEGLEAFKKAIPYIMSESYRDGYSRCSFGLDLDFQFSRTKLLIERGQYMFDRKALPELDNFEEFNK